jgi:S-DNA-T family DNA segregation ATPase FtsK/SpoIIIE
MRVAFMCNDTDADLVMGDSNREVKALSQQGEGIFNPSRGEPSHNKPFRGMYIAPDERSGHLSALEEKAAKAGFGRRPKVFDGDTLAERLDDPSRGSPTRPVLVLGEPFNLQAAAAITLRRGRASNLLLIGAVDDGESTDRAIDGAVQSCLADAAAQGLTIDVVDFVGDADDSSEWLDLMSLCRAVGASYRRASGFGDLLAEVGAELAARMGASDYGRDGRLLVLNGLERALDLAPADSYADPVEPAQRVAQPLAAVLRDGPEFGCHTLAVVDRLAQFDRRLGRDMLKEFDWRVAGSSLSPADMTAITESYREGEVRQSQLLLVDGAHGRNQRVRAYPRHTPTTIESVIQRRPA